MDIPTGDVREQATSYLKALSWLWGIGPMQVVAAQNMDYASAEEIEGKICQAIDKLLEYTEAGFGADEAQDLAQAIHDLNPLPGEERVSTLQKWRASVDFSDDVEDQLAALSAVMTDAQFQKVEIANNFGVSPDAYVTLQEIKPQYDADGNGSYKNAEIKAAVDGLPGYYTTEQKAVLWQLATGSTSARNNPYSRQVGQQVLDARAAAKEAAAQEQTEAPTDSTDDDSFSQALLDQLLGRG